ncbi:MAG: nucleotidyltransferase family protein [Cellulosilyticaceae bacterium]
MLQKNISEINMPERFKNKLIKDLNYLLQYGTLEINQIILFGSCARGTCKVTSDIDILLITKESLDRYTRGDIAGELDEAIDGVRTDIVFYSQPIFDTSESFFLKQVKEEGIIINVHQGGAYAEK